MNAQPNSPQFSSPPVADAGTTQFFVFSPDGQHIGPASADRIARGVTAGMVPNDAFVSVAGSNQWVPVGSVSEIAAALEATQRPTAPSPLPPPPQANSTIVIARPAHVPEDLAPAKLDAPPAKVEAPAGDAPKGLDPRLRVLPIAIFGGFAFLGAIETALTLLLR